MCLNEAKSTLLPTRKLTFIGAYLDSPAERALLPKEYTHLPSCVTMLPPTQTLSPLPITPGTYGGIYIHHAIRPPSHETPSVVAWLSIQLAEGPSQLVGPTVLTSLSWWCDPSKVMVGIPFNPPAPHVMLTMDAFLVGWGAHIQGHTAQGLWSPREAQMHISILELPAVQHASQALLPFVWYRHVQLLSDNMIAVIYINKQGGARSPTLC